MVIKLIRHAESMANVGMLEPAAVGDYSIPLTPAGHEQAQTLGRRLGTEFIDGALAYTSPYRRARETLAGLLEGAGVPRERLRVYEDPRLRELDFGYADVKAQQPMRVTHGWFYYRYAGGESPADCFDRTSAFVESLMRQMDRKKAESALIVTHGLTIRCFVMRFLHLPVEQFDNLANPVNCDIVTIAPAAEVPDAQLKTRKWGVTGLRFYEQQPPA